MMLLTGALNLSVAFPDMPAAVCFNEGVDPEVFHPPAGGGYAAAVEYAQTFCRRCDERLRCLAWALEQDERGVWGGTSEPDRRAMRAGRPPLVCRTCGNTFSDVGGPGPKRRRCPTCRIAAYNKNGDR